MKRIFSALALLLASATAFAFDHSHAAWSALPKKNVVLVQDGNASRVHYAGMLAGHPPLKAYLDAQPRLRFRHGFDREATVSSSSRTTGSLTMRVEMT